MFTESYPRRFSIQIHHSGEFSNEPKRVYNLEYTDHVDMIDCDTFSMCMLVKILVDLGLGDKEQKLFIHFMVPSLNLDDGLVPLMSDQDVKLFLNFVPRYKEVDVFVETDVLLVEKQLFEHTCWRKASKGIVIKEILQDDVVSAPNLNTKGKLLMLDWHNDEMAPTQTSCIACPSVENETQTSSHGYSYLNLMEMSDCDPMGSFMYSKGKQGVPCF